MQDLLPIIPSCFSPSPAAGDQDSTTDAPSTTTTTRLQGQSVVLSSYRALIAGQSRLVTVTWCKNLLALGLSVSIQQAGDSDSDTRCCKVEMRPWHFWRRHGTRRFEVGGAPVEVFWDLKGARFCADEPEPVSGYYVAVVSGEEVVLLLGDHKHDAFRRTGSRPSIHDAVLVSKKEHVLGKRRFTSRAKFGERAKTHEISIECTNYSNNLDCEMVIKIDGSVGVEVKHLQWKFRGHDWVCIDKVKVEVYWDVHDWLFGSGTSSSGLRHALFIFKPSSADSSSSEGKIGLELDDGSSSDFCLFLYAWKFE